jgi:hypothetical protein
LDQAKLLRYLLDLLERLDFDYAITGSYAVAAFGGAQSTKNIDVLMALSPGPMSALLAAFPFPRFVVYCDYAQNVRRADGGFSVVHAGSGQKIGVIAVTTDFDQWRMTRTVRIPAFADRVARFVGPEDLILETLYRYREGGSEEHLRDIVGIVSVTGDKLDRDYIDGMSSRMGLAAVWHAVLSRRSGG